MLAAELPISRWGAPSAAQLPVVILFSTAQQKPEPVVTIPAPSGPVHQPCLQKCRCKCFLPVQMCRGIQIRTLNMNVCVTRTNSCFQMQGAGEDRLPNFPCWSTRLHVQMLITTRACTGQSARLEEQLVHLSLPLPHGSLFPQLHPRLIIKIITSDFLHGSFSLARFWKARAPLSDFPHWALISARGPKVGRGAKSHHLPHTHHRGTDSFSRGVWYGGVISVRLSIRCGGVSKKRVLFSPNESTKYFRNKTSANQRGQTLKGVFKNKKTSQLVCNGKRCFKSSIGAHKCTLSQLSDAEQSSAKPLKTPSLGPFCPLFWSPLINSDICHITKQHCFPLSLLKLLLPLCH